MLHLVLVLLRLLVGRGILRKHLDVPTLIHVKRHISYYIQNDSFALTEGDQVLEIVGKRLTILDDITPVLPICEVVLTQVGSSYHHVVVEDVRFDVVYSEDLLHWPTEIFAFQEPSVWMMPEPDSKIPH